MEAINFQFHMNNQIMARNAFKNWCKSYLLKIQCDGNEQEWEACNFKLYSVKGIRRSERIRAQIYTKQLKHSEYCDNATHTKLSLQIYITSRHTDTYTYYLDILTLICI